MILPLHRASSPTFWPALSSSGSSAKTASIILNGPSQSPQTSPEMPQKHPLDRGMGKRGLSGTSPQAGGRSGHGPCLAVGTCRTSAIAEGTVGRGRPGDCSNRGDGHITVLLQQPEASHGSHLRCPRSCRDALTGPVLMQLACWLQSPFLPSAHLSMGSQT